MNVSSGYRKYGFDAYGGKYLQKSDMSYWMNNKLRTDPAGIAFELGKEIEEVELDYQSEMSHSYDRCNCKTFSE